MPCNVTVVGSEVEAQSDLSESVSDSRGGSSDEGSDGGPDEESADSEYEGGGVVDAVVDVRPGARTRQHSRGQEARAVASRI